MNPVQIHLLLNHFPIVGLLVVIFFFAYGLKANSSLLKNTCFISFFLLAVVTVVVFQTGESAEHIVEELPGVDHHLIHEHEESAELAYFLFLALGVIAAGAYYLNRRKHKQANVASIIVLIFSILTFALMVRAGHSGGQILHKDALNYESHKEHHDDD